MTTDKLDISRLIANLEDKAKQSVKLAIEEQYDAEGLSRLKTAYKEYSGEDKVISTRDIVANLKEQGEVYKILTGWAGVDKVLGGFTLGQVISISALTKSGKTSFCIDLTTRVAKENPLWFPFEEGGEELIQKFIERGEEPPFFYLPKSNKVNDLEWLEARIIEGIAKNNTRLVIIDHLDFIVPFSAGSDRHDLLIAKTMRELKQIAKRWGIVIIIIAHLKKAKMDTTPNLEDIRGSASIAQEADTALILWRQARREGVEMVITDNCIVSIQANRRTGKTGNIKMVYSSGKFLEQDWQDKPAERTGSSYQARKKADAEFDNF